MKPHPNNDLLHLLLILEAIEKIFIYSKTSNDATAFFDLNDGLQFNACLMQLIQIGEQSNKLSKELKHKYAHCNWREIQGFCNRVAHDYTGLDRYLTFDIIKEQLPGLKQQMTSIIKQEHAIGSFDEEELLLSKTSPNLRHVNFEDLYSAD